MLDNIFINIRLVSYEVVLKSFINFYHIFSGGWESFYRSGNKPVIVSSFTLPDAINLTHRYSHCINSSMKFLYFPLLNSKMRVCIIIWTSYIWPSSGMEILENYSILKFISKLPQHSFANMITRETYQSITSWHYEQTAAQERSLNFIIKEPLSIALKVNTASLFNIAKINFGLLVSPD